RRGDGERSRLRRVRARDLRRTERPDARAACVVGSRLQNRRMERSAGRALSAMKVVTIGLPLDENSSFLRGPALAPGRIREALFSDSSNLSTERGLDLTAHPDWRDAGDLPLSSGAAAMDEIDEAVTEVVACGDAAMCLGGDHSVTYPIVRAYAR